MVLSQAMNLHLFDPDFSVSFFHSPFATELAESSHKYANTFAIFHVNFSLIQ
jgi:hypothetical protein